MQNTFGKQKDTAVVLANASELVVGIISEMAGNDISNSLNGSKITADVVGQLVNQRVLSNLEQAKKV